MATKVVEDTGGQPPDPDPDSEQNCMGTSVLDDDVQEGLEALMLLQSSSGKPSDGEFRKVKSRNQGRVPDPDTENSRDTISKRHKKQKTRDTIDPATVPLPNGEEKTHNNTKSQTQTQPKQQLPQSHNFNPSQQQQHPSNSNSRKGPFTHLRYSDKHRGPCKFIVQRDHASGQVRENLNPMTYGKFFSSLYREAVLHVESEGFGKLSVTLKSFKEANKILDDTTTFKSKGVTAFVPGNFVSCQEVVKNIPLDFSEDEIRDNLEFLGQSRGTTSVLNVRRLNRKTIDRESNQRSYSPSTSVLITFEGTTLPERVALFKVSALVNLSVPQVKMCLKCHRYGHISTNRRSDSRCRQCGGTNTHTDQDPCPNANSVPKCVHCNGDHLPNSKNCREL